MCFRSGSYDNILPADLGTSDSPADPRHGGAESGVGSPRGSLASQLESGSGGYELVNFNRGSCSTALPSKKNSFDYTTAQNAAGRPEENQSGR
jgi:hypothetical protein